jgi:hypothetical protein
MLKDFTTKRELMEITDSDNLRHYRFFYCLVNGTYRVFIKFFYFFEYYTAHGFSTRNLTLFNSSKYLDCSVG